MHILKTPIHVCQNFENIYLTFVAYSSKTMSEMTQLTFFSRLCQKRHFLRLFLNLEKWCDFANKIYISISNVSLWDTYIVAIWILFATSLYICGKKIEVKYAPFLKIFNNDWKVRDRFLTLYIWITCIF